MSLFSVVLFGLLCYGGNSGRLTTRAPREAAGAWDENENPEAYYDDEDFFATKMPTVLPPSALMSGPVTKTFFLEKKVQLSQKGTEGWMEAGFVDPSTVQKLKKHQEPKTERWMATGFVDRSTVQKVKKHQEPKMQAKPRRAKNKLTREEKRALGPANNFRFRATETTKHTHGVYPPGFGAAMPPVAGINWNGDGPCPGGMSNAYFPGGEQPMDGPCYKFDYNTPYYSRPVRPLMPELQVGMQSPAVNFYSDGSRYPKNMQQFDHWAAQGDDTFLSPNSAGGKEEGGKGGKGGKK